MSRASVDHVLELDTKQVTLGTGAETLDWGAGRPLPDPAGPLSIDIHRYSRTAADTTFPLEYAFHLLSRVRGKTVVDLGCGEGMTTVILGALGARVLTVDSSQANLIRAARHAAANGSGAQVNLVQWESGPLPLADAIADHVLCAGICAQADPVVTARQIRRILKPGGTAVFEAPVIRSPLLEAIRKCRHEYTPAKRGALTPDDIDAISRGVGFPGRRCEFCIIPRPLPRETFLDCLAGRYFGFTRRFAALVVWEARKES